MNQRRSLKPLIIDLNITTYVGMYEIHTIQIKLGLWLHLHIHISRQYIATRSLLDLREGLERALGAQEAASATAEGEGGGE